MHVGELGELIARSLDRQMCSEGVDPDFTAVRNTP